MAITIAEHKRVLFVLWGRPEIADLAQIRARVTVLRAQPGPIVFIGRVPEGEEAPPDSMRKAMAAAMAELVPQFASYHGILEDRGFVGAAKRAVLSTLFLMTGQRTKSFVHARVDDLISAAPPELRDDVRAAIAVFRNRGLLDHHLNSVPPPPLAERTDGVATGVRAAALPDGAVALVEPARNGRRSA